MGRRGYCGRLNKRLSSRTGIEKNQRGNGEDVGNQDNSHDSHAMIGLIDSFIWTQGRNGYQRITFSICLTFLSYLTRQQHRGSQGDGSLSHSLTRISTGGRLAWTGSIVGFSGDFMLSILAEADPTINPLFYRRSGTRMRTPPNASALMSKMILRRKRLTAFTSLRSNLGSTESRPHQRE